MSYQSNSALRETLLKLVEAALVEVAGDQFDYVCFHLYRAQPDRPFYGVNLHKGHACQHGNGATLAEALAIALEKEPHIVPQDAAA